MEPITPQSSIDEVAEAVRNWTLVHPHEHTIQEVSEGADIDEVAVAYVFENYLVHEDGTLEHAPGQGSGWLSEEVAQQHRTLRDPDADTFSGYRWPDGTLREEQFDVHNASHLREMAEKLQK